MKTPEKQKNKFCVFSNHLITATISSNTGYMPNILITMHLFSLQTNNWTFIHIMYYNWLFKVKKQNAVVERI